MRIDFRNVLFWIFLIATVVLLLWYMIGDSPAEIIIYSGIAGIVLVKMWNFNGRLIRVEMGARNGFGMMKRDMDLVKSDLGLMRGDLGLVKDSLNLIKGRLGI